MHAGGWIQQHSARPATPVGHGFAPSPRPARPAAAGSAGRRAGRTHDGYYSFSPTPGLRFVVLDTITDECGAPVCAEGSLDDAQFTWLSQLSAAARGEYVMVFAHHTLRTIALPVDRRDRAADPLGERLDRRSQPPPRRPDGGTTLEELFCITRTSSRT